MAGKFVSATPAFERAAFLYRAANAEAASSKSARHDDSNGMSNPSHAQAKPRDPDAAIVCRKPCRILNSSCIIEE